MKRFKEINEGKYLSILEKLLKKKTISKDEFRSYINLMNEFAGTTKQFNKVVNNARMSNVLSDSDKTILDQADKILKLKGFVSLSVAKHLVKKEQEIEL